MKLEKRTYSLPYEIVARFEGRLASGQRSGTLAQIIQDWLDAQEREELRKQVLEGCDEMAAEYAAVDREWSGVADEVWRDG